MQTRSIDASTELQRALDLLVKNWTLALPTAIATLAFTWFLIVFVISAVTGITGGSILASGDSNASKAAGALLALFTSIPFLIGLPVLMLALIVANVMTIAAAEEAWQGRPPDFGRAFSIAMTKLPAIIVASLLIALMAIIPSMLIILLGLGLLLLLALGFFMMYVTAAIVLGNQSGTGAIGESFRIVRANAGSSALAFAAIIIVAIVGQIISTVVSHVPVLNLVSAFIVGGFTSAYTALVSARFYDILSGRTAAAPPPSTFITPAG
jgi:hypothetical protein